MRRTVNDEVLIVRYLLGDVSAEERGELQRRFFSDDEYFQRMLAVENDLIDSYARGELSSGEREQFEKNFLGSPAGRQRVEFARALAETVAVSPATRGAAEAHPPRASWRLSLPFLTRPHNRATRLALAAAAFVIAVGSALLIWQAVRQRPQGGRLQAERQTPAGRDRQSTELKPTPAEPKGDEPVSQRQQEQPPHVQTPEKNTRPQTAQQKTDRGRAMQPPVLSFVLSPRVVRGADETKRLSIPPRAQWVRLQLDLRWADDYKTYRATLTTAGGDEVWNQDGLPIRPTSWGKAVVLRVPARVLTTGSYELTLTGAAADGRLDEVGYYYFSVLKQ